MCVSVYVRVCMCVCVFRSYYQLTPAIAPGWLSWCSKFYRAATLDCSYVLCQTPLPHPSLVPAPLQFTVASQICAQLTGFGFQLPVDCCGHWCSLFRTIWLASHPAQRLIDGCNLCVRVCVCVVAYLLSTRHSLGFGVRVCMCVS